MLDQVKQQLNEFAAATVKRARFYLNVRKKNSTKDLFNSLGWEINTPKNKLRLRFTGMPYAGVVDKGRRAGKMPPISAIRKWINDKPVKLRNKKGQFIPKTEQAIDSAAYAIALKIKRKGVKGSDFFTDAFNDTFDKFPQQLTRNYSKSISTIYKNTFLNEFNRKIKRK